MSEGAGTRRLDPDELVDWPRRLEREMPLLERLLAEAPSGRALDLGCGSGRHAIRLAERGYEVTAIDASEERILAAQERPGAEAVQFLLGDIGAVERLVRGHFGAALCLGNTLPQLLSAESVSRLLVGLRRRLLPRASIVLQLLDYERVFEAGARSLPVEIVPGGVAPGGLESGGLGVGDAGADEQGETVIVRLLDPREDGIVLHTTVALRHRPAADPPIELLGTRRTQLRGWRLAELETMLDVARFEVREIYGGMDGKPFDPESSSELVVVAS